MNKIKTILARRNGKFTEEFELIEEAMKEEESKAEELLTAFGRAKPAFARYVESLNKQSKQSFRPYSLMSVLNWPPKEWLIKDLLGKGDIAMLFGEPGSGKSFLAIDLIITAITGEAFAGQFNIDHPLKTAYCAGEGLGDLQNRLAAATGKHSISPNGEAATRLTIFDNVPQLFDTNSDLSTYNFINEVSTNKPDLLIIDTFHTATLGMNENCTTDTGKAIEQTKCIQRELDCTVILIHHTNKTGGYRGSSSLHGAMDTMLQVKLADNIGSLECYKQKSAKEFQTLSFRLTSDNVSKSAYVKWTETVTIPPELTLAEEVRNKILKMLIDGKILNQGQVTEAVESEFKCSRNTARYAIKRLVESNLITEKKDGVYRVYSLTCQPL